MLVASWAAGAGAIARATRRLTFGFRVDRGHERGPIPEMVAPCSDGEEFGPVRIVCFVSRTSLKSPFAERRLGGPQASIRATLDYDPLSNQARNSCKTGDSTMNSRPASADSFS